MTDRPEHLDLLPDGVVVADGDGTVTAINAVAAGMLDAGPPEQAVGREPTVEQLENTSAQLDGRDERLLQWITDSEIVALIADNYAVEALPSREGGAPCCAGLPLHEHCLFKNGIHLGELWWLTPLARWLRAHGRHRFLLTAPPLRLPGAVGSPATPIATV